MKYEGLGAGCEPKSKGPVVEGNVGLGAELTEVIDWTFACELGGEIESE